MIHPDAQSEADRLLEIHAGERGYPDCLRLIRDQFNSLHTRNQLLLSLAAITLTITGFSGPKIAASGPAARWLLAIGLALCLGAVVWVLCGNLRVHWLTQFTALPPREALAEMIRWRDRKTRTHLRALALLVLGLAAYVAAVIVYLLTGDPGP